MINFISLHNINFTSKCVKNNVEILRMNENKVYSPYNAKLAEFDIYRDVDTIKSICEMDEFRSFGNDLYKSLYNDREYYCGTNEKHCYALVENIETNLANIDKDNVLGLYTLYETSNKDIPLSIPYFMTNGKYCNEYGSSTAKYKWIGKGMFKQITEMFPDKAICGYAAWAAMPFWEKLGFKHLSERRLVYIPNSLVNKIKLSIYM